MLKVLLIISLICLESWGVTAIIEKAHYDYHKKFQNENDTKISMVGRTGKATFIGSAEEISRYGLTDKQVGIETYIPLLTKEDKLYVNGSFFISPGNKFLSNYEYSLNAYKGIFDTTEVGVGYKSMNYNTKTIHLIKLMMSTALVSGIRIGENITHCPNDATTSYDTFIEFNNEKDLKLKYTYGVGESIEDFGVIGLKSLHHETNTAQIRYKLIDNTELGLVYVHEVYETLYTKDGGSIMLSYTW